ncbi:CAP domain-containing protein [Streptomyces sp. HUAS TT20]|uniref:CAP domain-containing protein n=1 Tax=Streptomyces sp. HUAS TT20 TaxID=3447509 RepID=UPI0021D8E0F0|nr:CAP domain-containing protein [Streptomyces sp. HUAS 15-9]UXY25625.1 CAP domain-containing protein [Streptomyces sp. HUAS 15-9]
MGKHRKSTQYRRIVITAVAMGAVGVPSVAMACTDWNDGGRPQRHSHRETEAKGWWNNADWGRPWNDYQDHNGQATPAPARTPSAPAKTTPPKPKATAPSHRVKVTAAPSPTAKTTAPRTTVPKAKVTTAPSAPRATTAAPATPAAPSAPKPTATASGVVARIVQLVNAERAKVGCSALTLNATLSKAAQAHSADMAAHQNMSHTGSDGSSPGDRITRAGYTWSAYGENVAYGYSTPESVMAGWMASPGHKANILNCSFKEIGVGLAQPNSFWTQDFGTAR